MHAVIQEVFFFLCVYAYIVYMHTNIYTHMYAYTYMIIIIIMYIYTLTPSGRSRRSFQAVVPRSHIPRVGSAQSGAAEQC